MPSLFSRIANLLPGFRASYSRGPVALADPAASGGAGGPGRTVNLNPPPGSLARPFEMPPETPADRAARLLSQTKQAIESSRGRPRPSTEERVPSNYGAGIAGRVWFLPHIESATHDSPDIRAAMRLMLRDPFVKAAWLTQVLSVASEDIQVQASEPGNPDSEEQAKFVEYALNEYLDGGPPALVQSITMPLGSDGFSLCEKVWGIASKGRHSGKIVAEAAKAKDPSWLRVEGDRFGTVGSVVSIRRAGERYPIGDFLYTRYLPVFNEALGMAAFRASYGDYWMRDTVRKLRIIHFEKKMAGMLVGEYEDDADRPAIETALAGAKTATWIAIPKGARISAVQLSTASEPDYKSFDDSLKEAIVVGITFAHLQMLQGDTPDGRGDSEVQKSTSDLAPWLLMTLAMHTINKQLIPDLIDYNYPFPAAGGYPKVTFGAVANKDLLEMLDVIEKAQQAGFDDLSKKHYAASLSLKRADPNDPSDKLTPSQQTVGGPGGPGGPGGNDPLDPFGGKSGGGGSSMPFSQFTEADRFKFLRPSGDEVLGAMVSRFGHWPGGRWLSHAEPAPHRKEGEVWQGESGHWFTKKNGHVVPHAAPDQGGNDAGDPGKSAPSPTGQSQPAPHDAADPGGAHTLSELARDFPHEAADPETWRKATTAVGRVREAVYGWMVRNTDKINALASVLGAVFDTPDDMKKFGYSPGMTSQVAGHDLGDPIKAQIGISTHLATAIASKVLAKAFVWAKGRLTKTSAHAEGDGMDELAAALRELFGVVNEALGLDGPLPDVATVAKGLREVAAARGDTSVFKEDDQGHEHRGKGPHGGEFTKKGSGGDDSGGGTSKPAKAPEKPVKPAAPAPKPTSQPAAKSGTINTPSEPAGATADPDANRPSRPENRHAGARPPALEWKEPPTPAGKKGKGPAKRPKGKRSQTKLGDAAEQASYGLGFRNILPAGRRNNKDVKTEGSSIDVEYDHSGRAYEVKMCKTTATEYRAKPKPDEIEGKVRYAKMHGLTAYTMIGVMDEKAGVIHYYASKEPGITTKKLSKDHFDYVGTAKF